jgi:nucleotide-binding universal stress UspA family protein
MKIMLTDYSRIVVAYDHSELSKKALNMAMNLAKQDKMIQLYVVMVMSPITPIPYGYGTSIVKLHEQHLKEFQDLRAEVEEVLQVLPNKTGTFVLDGNPGYMIVEFVKENDADLVVMGSRGLSGLKELFLGSVSHFVVQKSPCPVLIVK